MTKIPRFLADLIQPGEQFCEAHGEAMARWAMGTSAAADKPADPTAVALGELADEVRAATSHAALDGLRDRAKALKLARNQQQWMAGIFAEARARVGIAASAPTSEEAAHDAAS